MTEPMTEMDELHLTQAIQSALGRKAAGEQVDIVEIVPIPLHSDRMVRLRTLEEILDEFDRSGDFATEGMTGYLVQVKPTHKTETAKKSEPVSSLAKAGSEGIYHPNGKLNLPYLTRNAEMLFSSGDYVLARNIYKAILQSGERTSVALYGIGRCYEAEGRIEEAKSNYSESIAYHPTLDAYRHLSSLLIREKKDQEAAEAIARALNLKGLTVKQRFELHKACGNCWARAGRTNEADTHYKKAIEIDPSADEVHVNLGNLHLQTGKLQFARRHFQDALAVNPRNTQAFNGLGSSALAENRTREAHDHFAKALEIDLRNPTAVFHLVKCAYELKSYATAARIVEEYVETAPVNTDLLYSLAGLQFHLGRITQARATTLKILELAPHHVGSRELLDMIDKYAGG